MEFELASSAISLAEESTSCAPSSILIIVLLISSIPADNSCKDEEIWIVASLLSIIWLLIFSVVLLIRLEPNFIETIACCKVSKNRLIPLIICPTSSSELPSMQAVKSPSLSSNFSIISPRLLLAFFNGVIIVFIKVQNPAAADMINRVAIDQTIIIDRVTLDLINEFSCSILSSRTD